MSISLLLEHRPYLTITIITEIFLSAPLIYSDLTSLNDQSHKDFITMNAI